MSIVAQADKVVRELLAGRYNDPVMNIHNITQAEFLRLVPMAQFLSRQGVRHGVTPMASGWAIRQTENRCRTRPTRE